MAVFKMEDFQKAINAGPKELDAEETARLETFKKAQDEEIRQELEEEGQRMMWGRFLRATLNGGETDLDMRTYWEMKKQDCLMCGEVPGTSITRHGNVEYGVPSGKVWRIDPKGGFFKENLIPVCHSCGSKVRGKNPLKYMMGEISEGARNAVREMAQMAGKEAAKEQLVREYQAVMQPKAEDTADWL